MWGVYLKCPSVQKKMLTKLRKAVIFIDGKSEWNLAVVDTTLALGRHLDKLFRLPQIHSLLWWFGKTGLVHNRIDRKCGIYVYPVRSEDSHIKSPDTIDGWSVYCLSWWGGKVQHHADKIRSTHDFREVLVYCLWRHRSKKLCNQWTSENCGR